MVQRDGMPRLALIFLHSVNAGGCFRWRDEDSTRIGPPMRPDPAAGNGCLGHAGRRTGRAGLIVRGRERPHRGYLKLPLNPERFSRRCPDMRRYYPSLNMFLTSIADQSSLTDSTLTLELSDALTSA
jgi:hypothetical protein